MDDPLIAGGAVLATALLILINWLIGGWQVARIDSESTARQRYAQDFPDDCILEAAIDRSGRAALLASDDPGVTGLIVALGGRLATRRLRARDLRAVTCDDTTLTVRLDDFVLSRVRLELDASTAQAWHERLTRPMDEEAAQTAA